MRYVARCTSELPRGLGWRGVFQGILIVILCNVTLLELAALVVRFGSHKLDLIDERETL